MQSWLTQGAARCRGGRHRGRRPESGLTHGPQRRIAGRIPSPPVNGRAVPTPRGASSLRWEGAGPLPHSPWAAEDRVVAPDKVEGKSVSPGQHRTLRAAFPLLVGKRSGSVPHRSVAFPFNHRDFSILDPRTILQPRSFPCPRFTPLTSRPTFFPLSDIHTSPLIPPKPAQSPAQASSNRRAPAHSP